MIHKSIEQLKLYPPGTHFNIKAKNFDDGKVKILKDIPLPEYEKSLKYLKYLNAQGYNVFLSPCVAGGVTDVLLDDINLQTLARLQNDGFEPHYYLETSPGNYQAIIKLSDTLIDKNIQKFISIQLANICSADINSTDPGHFFRLAGFTNRKEKYRTSAGLYPFVKLYPGILKPCAKGKDYIDNILEGIKAGLIELPERNITTPPLQAGDKGATADNCYSYIKKVYESNQNIKDLSALDFKACRYAALKGFDLNDIKEAIRRLSPDIENRKRGHIDDYLNRTIKNACSPKK